MTSEQRTRTPSKVDLLAVISSISLLLLVWCAYETFATVVFFWPLLKLVGYWTIVILLVSLSHRSEVGRPSNVALGVEISIVLLLILLAQEISVAQLPRPLFSPAVLDIGTLVEMAIRNFFVLHENPYYPSEVGRWSSFPGVAFMYGPLMMFGYLPAIWGPFWFKVCSFVYIAGILVLTGRFAAQGVQGVVPKIAAIVFATAVVTMPRALLNDVSMGINDHLPVFLVLASLSLLQVSKSGAAGFLAGLSLSAKFSPAAFLIILMIRRKFPFRFFVGVALGCLPMVPFFLWEPARFFHDVVYFHFVKGGTPTSIFTITPPELHNLIRDGRLVCVVIFVARNFLKEVDVDSLMYEFTLMAVIINSLHVEMHSNYLVWVLPTSAVLFSRYRYRAWSLGRSVLGLSDAAPSLPR